MVSEWKSSSVFTELKEDGDLTNEPSETILEAKIMILNDLDTTQAVLFIE